MRLTPHVYQLCGRSYGSHQNVFAIDAEHSLILIDTGLGEKDLHILYRNLSAWGLDHKPVKAVLLTHEHYEHISNAVHFQNLGAHIYAHAKTAKALRSGDDWIMYYAYAEYPMLKPFTVNYPINADTSFLIDGVSIQAWEAPGHSGGSLLYETKIDHARIVFSGDTILVTDICHKAAFGCSAGIDYAQDVYVETLKKFSSHTADILLPGHGELCMRRADQIFIGAYLRARLDIVTDHHRQYLQIEEDAYAA